MKRGSTEVEQASQVGQVNLKWAMTARAFVVRRARLTSDLSEFMERRVKHIALVLREGHADESVIELSPSEAFALAGLLTRAAEAAEATEEVE